ncbi:MAG TPA: AAA family ATPase [Firmicutes bacterium]|nr:AAA family ATPase [Bacillota bacterium]
MQDKVKAFLVSSDASIIDGIRSSPGLQGDVEFVGSAPGAEEALGVIGMLRPDVVLVDIDTPAGPNAGIISTILAGAPMVTVIAISASSEVSSLRQAMIAGAREYLLKPIERNELLASVSKAYDADRMLRKLEHGAGAVSATFKPLQHKGKVIAVFSTKGGVGKTTIAVNLAVSLARETREKVSIVDLDLEFGDVALLLDVVPPRTFADIARRGNIDREFVEYCLVSHASGLRILAAPGRPELAELVGVEHVRRTLGILKESFDYIVVDTAQSFSENVLSALDTADVILLVTTLEIPSIKNTRMCLDLMKSLRYPEEKTKIVVNRSSREIGINPREVEKTLGRTVDVHVPSDGRVVVPSVNSGVPFVMAAPGSAIARSIRDLARSLAGTREKTRSFALPGFRFAE